MSSEIPDQATLHPYQLFMLPLCFYTLGGMVADALVKFDNSTRAILEYADIAVCAIFFLDFLISLANAQNKLRYFFTWGWIDLASSIPTIDVYVGDAQLVYWESFVCYAGLVTATKLIAVFVLEKRSEGAFLAATLISILLIVFSSIAIL